MSDWVIENDLLKERLQNAKTVPGTRKFHYFSPINENELKVNIFSSCQEFTVEKVIKKIPKAVLTLNTGNYITVAYRNYWWLALVNGINQNNHELSVMLFHPHGPSIQYLPHPEDELIIDFSDVLTIVTPITNKTGCVYYLSKDETNFADGSLKCLS